MEYEYKVAWCPFCEQGWVEIVKNTADEHLWLCCAECFTFWEKPEDIAAEKPALNISLELVVPPTRQEVEHAGWDGHIIKD